MNKLKFSEYAYILPIAAVVMLFSIFGPSSISKYNDAKILNSIILENKDGIEGYKYNDTDRPHVISPDEKFYILSNALNNRILPQSDYSALIRLRNNPASVRAQSYALLPNYKNQNAADKTQVLDRLGTELDKISQRGIIPEFRWQLTPSYYEVSYFSAIDMLDPQKNVPILQVDVSQTSQLSRLRDIMVSACIDAQTNKIYSISIRNNKSWEDYNSDHIAEEWCKYLGLSAPENIHVENTLIEDTPYFKKYVVDGVDGDKTTITIGFFEGINEFFIKISR